MKHLTSLFEWTAQEVEDVLQLAAKLKAGFLKGQRPPLLQGRVLAQVFDKPSLRTRVSFEAAIVQLGGSSTFLTSKDAGWTGREALPDVARVLSSYCDAIVIRTFSQALIEEVAQHSSCPVINGLSDDRHPCQALADVMTLQEHFGSVAGRRLVYVGDGNNVANSLAIISAQLGMDMTVCAPPGYELKTAFLAELNAHLPKSTLKTTHDLRAAVKQADVIYTDVWASMGQESEADDRERTFMPYQINAKVFAAAPKDCVFLHCLPARRGKEVTDDVIDSERSLVFPQAENRMHLAKGLLVKLING